MRRKALILLAGVVLAAVGALAWRLGIRWRTQLRRWRAAHF